MLKINNDSFYWDLNLYIFNEKRDNELNKIFGKGKGNINLLIVLIILIILIL